MAFSVSRRHALGIIAAAGAALAGSPNALFAAIGEGFHLGPPEPFDFDKLTAAAKALAAKPYVAPVVKAAKVLDRIDFEEQIEINYRADRTIMPGTATPIRLFHPHKFAKEGVHIHIIDNGSAREVMYNADLFTFGPKAAVFAKKLPSDIGFAGFRILNPNLRGDWLAFQGASYFRSSGELSQYGLSARGLAVDSGLMPEEFPLFTHFYLERQHRRRLSLSLPQAEDRDDGC
jgi:glucans biosynthesis protein